MGQDLSLQFIRGQSVGWRTQWPMAIQQSTISLQKSCRSWRSNSHLEGSGRHVERLRHREDALRVGWPTACSPPGAIYRLLPSIGGSPFQRAVENYYEYAKDCC